MSAMTDRKRNAEVLWRWIGERRECFVSCRHRKVHEGGGCWHWATDYLLDCDPERKIDIDRFCELAGIKRYETPYLSYGLANKLGAGRVEQHGDTIVVKARGRRK